MAVAKIGRTIERDSKNLRQISEEGWKVSVLWECELRDEAALDARLNSFFEI